MEIRPTQSQSLNDVVFIHYYGRKYGRLNMFSIRDNRLSVDGDLDVHLTFLQIIGTSHYVPK